MGLNVAVLANLKSNAPALPEPVPDAWAELDSESTIQAIVEAIESLGHRATFLEGDHRLPQTLVALSPDLCFNICEGHWGDSRESHVPAILEMLRIPYTGSGVLALAVTLDKPTTKRLLASHGLPTPAFQVFTRAEEPLDAGLRFPLFVKPSREGSSMGVTSRSIVTGEAELRERLAEHLARYRQPVLVERFVGGREVTVGLIGNPAARAHGEPATAGVPGVRLLPPLQVDLDRYPASEGGVYTHRIKTEPWEQYHFTCPAPLPPDVLARLQAMALEAFLATGCVDVARVDFRLDAGEGDAPYILEINALPGLAPGYSDLSLSAEAAGLSYAALIGGILDAAIARHGLSSQGRG